MLRLTDFPSSILSSVTLVITTVLRAFLLASPYDPALGSYQSSPQRKRELSAGYIAAASNKQPSNFPVTPAVYLREVGKRVVNGARTGQIPRPL